MFVVVLRFSANKARAADFMRAHNEWISQGFEDGVFLLAGSLQPGKGGTVIAHNATLEQVQARVDRDPFVAEDVVSAEILEIAPARTDEKLAFLAA
jgi:uncharacterized protein YciI